MPTCRMQSVNVLSVNILRNKYSYNLLFRAEFIGVITKYSYR